MTASLLYRMTHLYDLPDELLDEISSFCYNDMILVSHRLHAVSLPHYYRDVRVHDRKILLLARTVSLNLLLGTLVRRLCATYEEEPSYPIASTEGRNDEYAEARAVVSGAAAKAQDYQLEGEIRRRHPWTPSASLAFLLYLLPGLQDMLIAPQYSSVPFYRTAADPRL